MLSLNKADTYFLKGDIVMAKVCINCGKKIGTFSMESPFELCNGQTLCSKCAEPIVPKIKKLYSVLYNTPVGDGFGTMKDEIIQECKRIYNEVAVSAVEAKIDEIYQDEIKPQLDKSKLETEKAEKKKLQEEENRRLSKEEMERLAAEQSALKLAAKDQMLTTGYDFSGYHITKYVGIVSGEVVLGTGFLSEFSASVSDLFGASSGAFEEKLDTAKKAAIEKLTIKSVKEGGNAIIGVDFDYITFANNMIGVVANGTSVVIEKMK